VFLVSLLCPSGKQVRGTQLSEQKKTPPVGSTSKPKNMKKAVPMGTNIANHAGVFGTGWIGFFQVVATSLLPWMTDSPVYCSWTSRDSQQDECH